MPRRVWIIKRKEKLDKKDYEDARANNCPEICNGLPPRLANLVDANEKPIYTEDMLPMVYEEPDTPRTPPRDLVKEVDEVKTNLQTTSSEVNNIKAILQSLSTKVAEVDTLKLSLQAIKERLGIQ